MPLSERQLLDSLSRTPFVDSAELAGVLGRGSRDGSPRPDRPAGRGHRRARQPRDRPPAFEPEILPDGKGHRRSRRDLRLRYALGLRAGLPRVQGVADAAHPQDGRGGLSLPSCRVTLPRHRLAPVARGVSPQGPLRRHHHPPRRPDVRRGAPGPGPAAPVSLRPAEGNSGVRLRPSPQRDPDPDAQRLGAQADGEVLHKPESTDGQGWTA